MVCLAPSSRWGELNNSGEWISTRLCVMPGTTTAATTRDYGCQSSRFAAGSRVAVSLVVEPKTSHPNFGSIGRVAWCPPRVAMDVVMGARHMNSRTSMSSSSRKFLPMTSVRFLYLLVSEPIRHGMVPRCPLREASAIHWVQSELWLWCGSLR